MRLLEGAKLNKLAGKAGAFLDISPEVAVEEECIGCPHSNNELGLTTASHHNK